MLKANGFDIPLPVIWEPVSFEPPVRYFRYNGRKNCANDRHKSAMSRRQGRRGIGQQAAPPHQQVLHPTEDETNPDARSPAQHSQSRSPE